MADITFEEAIRRAIHRDSRYTAGAYEFVRDSLHISVEKFRGGDEAQHVSGQELLEGVKHLALKEFGPMALTILNTWGLQAGIDIGNIVYNLIEVGYFGRSEGDTLDDFIDNSDWEQSFAQPFLPNRLQKSKLSKAA